MAASLIVNNLSGAVIGPFDLTVEPGTCAAITGPSGAGKSLFLRMIADLDPNRGDVHLGPMDRAHVTAPVWRAAICYCAAEPGWWADTFAAHLAPALLQTATTLAHRLGLDATYLERPLGLLSTGERQRLGLVRALCHAPAVLLLDEPTSALDRASVEAVETLLRDHLDAGLILVMVSHDQALADRLGTKRYELAAGRLAPR